MRSWSVFSCAVATSSTGDQSGCASEAATNPTTSSERVIGVLHELPNIKLTCPAAKPTATTNKPVNGAKQTTRPRSGAATGSARSTNNDELPRHSGPPISLPCDNGLFDPRQGHVRIRLCSTNLRLQSAGFAPLKDLS